VQGIFISYRREDAAGYAGRLYDRLASHFGAARVFMDVEGIEPGVDFVEAIERAVGSCEVLIVIIGNEWLTVASSDGKRRLDDPRDFVRIETAAALARGIRVVPVLVENAAMPREDQLPPELKSLTRRQAVELSHKQWDATSSELIQRLERVLGGPKASAGAAPAGAEPRTPGLQVDATPGDAAQTSRRSWLIGGAIAIAVAIAAAAVYVMQPWVAPEPGRIAEAPRAETPAPRPEAARPDAPGPKPETPMPAAPKSEMAAPAPKAETPVPVPKAETPVPAPKTETPVPVPKAETPVPAPKAESPAPAPKAESPVPAPKAEPPAPAPGAERPTSAPEPEAAAPKAATPRTPPPAAKTETPPERPRILSFEARVRDGSVQLCYGVANATIATITPSVGPVKPASKDCVPVAAPEETTTYTLTARNTAGLTVTRSLAIDGRPRPSPLVAVPNLVGRNEADAVKALESAGLAVRIVEDKLDPGASGAPGSVVAQLPRGGEEVKTGARVTLQIMPASGPVAALPSALPRAGDVWEYRLRSNIFRNIEPRTYMHQVTAVSEREVRETLSSVVGGERVSDTKGFGPDARFVEWRAKGLYFVEFNPFLEAFGGLQKLGGSSKLPALPAEDPFFGNWASQGRAVAWDSVAVPAGTFKALRFEINSHRAPTGSVAMRGSEPVRVVHVIWFAPEAKRTVKVVRTTWSTGGTRLDEDTYELVKYRVQ
jgi:hypothetical protein